MKLFPFFVILIGLFFVSFGEGTDVIELDESNFDATIKASSSEEKPKDWLLEFYAPWCGHCKQLAPTWEQVATDLKGKMNVAKINADSNKQLGGRFGVRGYPTIIAMKNGKVKEYEGKRSKSSIVEWALTVEATDDISNAPPRVPINLKKTLLTALEDFSLILADKPVSAIILLLFGVLIGWLFGILCCCDTDYYPQNEELRAQEKTPSNPIVPQQVNKNNENADISANNNNNNNINNNVNNLNNTNANNDHINNNHVGNNTSNSNSEVNQCCDGNVDHSKIENIEKDEIQKKK